MKKKLIWLYLDWAGWREYHKRRRIREGHWWEIVKSDWIEFWDHMARLTYGQ